jgi:myo-inositol-1(or 4)-monophosphatase
MDVDWKSAKKTAVRAAMAAGDILLDGLTADKQISRKSSAVDLLTQYDQAAESIIVNRLINAYPDHKIVAEEGSSRSQSNDTCDYIWYVDPLDGTNNYSHNYPVFAVSIALYEKNIPRVGVIYDPNRNECFHAIAGSGAHLTKDGATVPLKVSGASELVESLLATGFPYDRHHADDDNVEPTRAFLKRALGIRRSGSASLDLANVAAGRLDGYWEYKLSSWDVAAGILLVREAGGFVTGIAGGDVILSNKMALVATNGSIHDLMVAVLGTISGSMVGSETGSETGSITATANRKE